MQKYSLRLNHDIYAQFIIPFGSICSWFDKTWKILCSIISGRLLPDIAWIAVKCIKLVVKVFLERSETWVCTMLLWRYVKTLATCCWFCLNSIQVCSRSLFKLESSECSGTLEFWNLKIGILSYFWSIVSGFSLCVQSLLVCLKFNNLCVRCSCHTAAPREPCGLITRA